jgi:nucleotide-binding universal stress UspA family protein
MSTITRRNEMRLLLALDDTSDSERIAMALSGWASDTSPEVHILTVMSPAQIHETSRRAASHTPVVPTAVTTTGVSIGMREQPLRLAEDRSQAFVRVRSEREEGLREVARKAFPSSDVIVHIEDSERTARAILDAAERLDVDLVAMGARDRSPLSAAVFGSVHEEVVRFSRVPVLVVGPSAAVDEAQGS